MLTVYDESGLAVAVFNNYGDIVYKNHQAGELIHASCFKRVKCKKIRLMVDSLLKGLMRPPVQFHVDLGQHQRFLCYINHWHQSYTLHLQAVPLQGYVARPRLSRWLNQLP